MSTPNIQSNFNPYAPHYNGGANVHNSTRIPPITSDEEQNFNSAPANPYNHNSRGTNARVELNRDVGKVVRQWNLKFNGSSKSWSTFRTAFRSQFGNDNFHRRVRDHIRARTQGAKEKIEDYLTCLLGLYDKLDGPYSVREQVDNAQRELRPEFRRVIKRKNIADFKELAQLGKDWGRNGQPSAITKHPLRRKPHFYRNSRIRAKKLGTRGQVWQLGTRISRRKVFLAKKHIHLRGQRDGTQCHIAHLGKIVLGRVEKLGTTTRKDFPQRTSLNKTWQK